MKAKVIIIILLLLYSIANQINAQEIRELTAYSYCNGFEVKSATSDYNLGYSYRVSDSTLIISGRLGSENCGIEHIFSARIDSNKVVLSEIINDSLLTTCTCSKIMKMEIDSFYYDYFTVEFEGGFLSAISSIRLKDNLIFYPNPTKGLVYFDLSGMTLSTEIVLIDCFGKTLITEKINGQNFIEFDLSNYSPGLYLVKIKDLNLTRLLIKN